MLLVPKRPDRGVIKVRGTLSSCLNEKRHLKGTALADRGRRNPIPPRQIIDVSPEKQYNRTFVLLLSVSVVYWVRGPIVAGGERAGHGRSLSSIGAIRGGST